MRGLEWCMRSSFVSTEHARNLDFRDDDVIIIGRDAFKFLNWNGQMESPHSKGYLKWTDGRPSQQRSFWNGQMEGPHSKGSWCPSTWSETNWQPTHTSDGLRQTGSLPILQMSDPNWQLTHTSEDKDLPCFSSGNWKKVACAQKPLTGCEDWLVQPYKTERDHPNIEKLQLLLVV